MALATSYETPVEGAFNNAPQPSQYFEAVPLSSALGAEIRGLNLAAITDAAFTDLEAALYHHKMIYLRGQSLSFSDQERVTQRFGSFGVDAFTEGVPGHENVQRVVKEADERRPMVFGGTWHTDSAFLPCPPSVSMLYAVDVPPFGGDTWWANTQLAYTFLSETMKSMLLPLQVRMSAYRVVRGIESRREGKTQAMTSVAPEFKARGYSKEGQLHPLIRTHPKTGKRSLYVDQTYSTGIDGLRKPEAQALINFLTEHIIQPAFTCRLRWENNTLVMWDNRATVHHAFNDYDGYRREMFRTIVEGEAPA
jgi:alpha-ketoglutarate-dependent taurine dioxygenase